MKIENILKLRDISPVAKLLVIDIAEFPSLITYNKLSQEISNDIGCKRKDVLKALLELQEMGYITCKVEARNRKTAITKLLKSIIQ